jgi:hypothetical protein
LEELNQEHSYKGFWSSSLYTYEHDQPFSLYKTRLEYLGDDSYSTELLEEKANELSAHTVDDLSYIIPNEPEYIRLNELVHREEEICTQKSGQKIFYEILTCITEQRDYVHLQDFTVQSFLSYNTLIDYNNFMYYYGERLSEYSVSHPEEYYLFMEEYLGGKSEVPFNQEYSFFCEMNPTCMV